LSVNTARGIRLVLLLTFSAVILAAPACKKAAPPPAPLPPVSAAPKAAPVAKQAEVPQEEQPEVFSYNPEGVRDPFGSLLRIKKDEDTIPEELLTPLQRVPVTDLRVEGIILMGKKSVAHVIAPDGKPYIVTVGTLMGRNDGKVVRITSEELVVEEQFEDYLGRKFKQETALRLRKKEEESL
jgi:type IV pilus assembly protein PilP